MGEVSNGYKSHSDLFIALGCLILYGLMRLAHAGICMDLEEEAGEPI